MQLVRITGNANICKWEKYLGTSINDLISLFGAPKILSETELKYYHEDLDHGVIFYIKNNVTVEIVLVGDL